jgi:hypothetical protein
MIVKIRVPRFASPGAAQTPDLPAMQTPRLGSTFQATLSDAAEDWVVRETTHAFVKPPKPVSRMKERPGTVARTWAWLQTKYAQTTTKRMHISETVSLGEKRFVSIVSIDGREFLIGGGTAGVALLTQLDAAKDSGNSPSLRNFRGESA